MLVRKKGSPILNDWKDTEKNRLRLKQWNMEVYHGPFDVLDGVYYLPGYVVGGNRVIWKNTGSKKRHIINKNN